MGKTGADFCQLQAYFKATMHEYKNAVDDKRPRCLDPLRAQIPSSSTYEKPLVYEHDPDLDMRTEYGNAWEKHYHEGLKLMAVFNEKMRDAILKAKENGMSCKGLTVWMIYLDVGDNR